MVKGTCPHCHKEFQRLGAHTTCNKAPSTHPGADAGAGAAPEQSAAKSVSSSREKKKSAGTPVSRDLAVARTGAGAGAGAAPEQSAAKSASSREKKKSASTPVSRNLAVARTPVVARDPVAGFVASDAHGTSASAKSTKSGKTERKPAAKSTPPVVNPSGGTKGGGEDKASANMTKTPSEKEKEKHAAKTSSSASSRSQDASRAERMPGRSGKKGEKNTTKKAAASNPSAAAAANSGDSLSGNAEKEKKPVKRSTVVSAPSGNRAGPTRAPGKTADRRSTENPRDPQIVIDVLGLGDVAREAMEDLNLEASHNPLNQLIAFVNNEVKLKQHDKDTTQHAFAPFRDRVKGHLDDPGNGLSGSPTTTRGSSHHHQSDPANDLKWDILNSGSSYDGTKVTRADEVDCMFVPHLPSDWLTICRDQAPPGFCFVEMTSRVPHDDDPRGRFLRSLCDGASGRLSSLLFRQKVFKVLRKAVSSERRAREDPDAKPGSASFPVLLNAIPGHRPVSIDLVPALKLEGFPSGSDVNLKHVPRKETEAIRSKGYHVIAKQCPHVKYQAVQPLLWRLSFSQAEKELTKFADRRLQEPAQPGQDPKKMPPTCRKTVMRILKRLLEVFKGMDNSRQKNPKVEQLRQAADYLRKHKGYGDLTVDKFTTFQIRTLLWRCYYVLCPNPDKWSNTSMRTRLMDSLGKLIDMLSGRMRVTHFFLPELDIMAEVTQREREFLYILFFIAKELF